MVYLDYFLYIVIIVLFYILINKIVYDEMSDKEGFKHLGKGFIAEKAKIKKEDKDKCTQKNSNMSYDNEYLDEDAAEEARINCYEDDSQYKNGIITVRTTYAIAKDVAIILIKMPYQFLSKGLNMLIEYIQHFNDILKPIYAFISQMGQIIKRLIKQFYAIFKKIFTQVFNILSDLPGFIKKYATVAIDFINTAITKTIDMFQNFFDLFQNMLDNLLSIPEKFFNIMNQLSDVLFNTFNMLIKIPEKGLDMVIGFQGTLMTAMDRPLKIPFSDLFLG